MARRRSQCSPPSRRFPLQFDRFTLPGFHQPDGHFHHKNPLLSPRSSRRKDMAEPARKFEDAALVLWPTSYPKLYSVDVQPAVNASYNGKVQIDVDANNNFTGVTWYPGSSYPNGGVTPQSSSWDGTELSWSISAAQDYTGGTVTVGPPPTNTVTISGSFSPARNPRQVPGTWTATQTT